MSATADLEAFVAFLAEHQRCGDLHAGKDNGFIWMDCSCSALIMRPPDRVPAGRPAPDWWPA